MYIKVKILFVISALFLIVYSAYSDIDNLRQYPHPIICKPFVKTSTGVRMAEQNKWVILTWASLEEITEKTLIFKTKDGDFYIPAAGFMCSQ